MKLLQAGIFGFSTNWDSCGDQPFSISRRRVTTPIKRRDSRHQIDLYLCWNPKMINGAVKRDCGSQTPVRVPRTVYNMRQSLYLGRVDLQAMESQPGFGAGCA
jgi:hypothetical protein